MIWLTWRQFRGAAALGTALLAVVGAILVLTGPGMASDYADGIAACTGRPGGCREFVQAFRNEHDTAFLAILALVLVMPAIIGLFWGAPLIARELEAGTHRLVWNQSVTRTRWLMVKFGIVGLAAVVAGGIATLAATWWAGPLDKAVATDYPRMGPLLFDTRGIVPIGHAVFAFALGAAAGLLIRRTLPAMTLTLVVFIAVQIGMPMLVRPHLMPPTSGTFEINESNLGQLNARPPGGGPPGPIRVVTHAPTGAWLLSNHTVDASGKKVDKISLTPTSEACRPTADKGLSGCFAEIKRLGYRQHMTYQPLSHYWPLQWIETGLFTGAALGLTGFCFWYTRRRLV